MSLSAQCSGLCWHCTEQGRERLARDAAPALPAGLPSEFDAVVTEIRAHDEATGTLPRWGSRPVGEAANQAEHDRRWLLAVLDRTPAGLPDAARVEDAAREVVRFHGTDRTWSLTYRTLLGSRIDDLAAALEGSATLPSDPEKEPHA